MLSGGKVAIVAEVLGKTTAMPLDVCGIRSNYSRVTSDVQVELLTLQNSRTSSSLYHH